MTARCREVLTVTASGKAFDTVLRIDTPVEAEYYRHGGILPYVLRRLHAGVPDFSATVHSTGQ